MNVYEIVRPFGRRLLAIRFRLFQRHRHNALVLEQVAGKSLLVFPEVFNPKLFRTGEFLAQQLDERLIAPDAHVLDMGTGTGVGAVFAARWAARVVAVDINPEAVRCARINALLHHSERKIDVRQGNLFEAVPDEQFDLILFNPPYYDGEPRGALDYAFRSRDAMQRFAEGARAALKPGGQILLMVSTDMNLAQVQTHMRANGFSVEVFWKKDLINETVYIYKCKIA